ncbi:MAG: hypothetical protein ABIH71_05945 [Candidatus Omnitrophota bacterium]|nr:hypothetical protein [Candidatus Omnitrophota bacterium]
MSIKFGTYTSEKTVIKSKIATLKYDQIKSLSYSDIAEYVNTSPIVENLKLTITFHNGHQIDLHEKIDIRPAILRIPFTHLFNSSKRKASKRQILEKQLQDKMRFTEIIRYIEEKAGLQGKKI